MAATGLGGEELTAAFIVETSDEVWVLQPAGVAGHLHDGVLFPQASGIAEGGDAALGTHTCTCKENYFFSVGHDNELCEMLYVKCQTHGISLQRYKVFDNEIAFICKKMRYFAI